MNKKMWSRFLLAGVLSMSLLAVAGCGESEADKQAKFEQMKQEAAVRDREDKLAVSDKLSKVEIWRKAINTIKEKGELKGAPIEISGNMAYEQKAIKLDVVKAGTTELVRYHYGIDDQTWSDGEPVEVVGPGKKDIARTFYSIDSLNPDMMVTVIEAFKKEAQSNPELQDSYAGYITKASMGWSPKSQRVFYYVEQHESGGGSFETDRVIEAFYDANGNITQLKVKPKGTKDRKTLIKK